MKTSQTATVFAALGLVVAAATLAMTAPAESFSYRLAPPSEAVQRSAEAPSLDNLAVLDLVTAYGDDQAYDEPYCDVRVTVTEKLSNDFEENRVSAPQERDGVFVELWASDRLGTWTMLATRTDGIACVIETGRDWAGETGLDALAAG
ncbi:hypothetical protein GVY41_10445 [Frigidibacter albus]|uniref:Uncharacterized protein n=1 Tax=Frigidibacter albus TaxID=1465486 RepID=A0A6L8VJL6_9RHOB|nr:hypothetical protein [Frigidibacter albus]MZQ89509.1 hypothetical protein [Frigidibacter albus]NBE31415.1 hypothetical protein [Frigidibacter albus]GGH55573.1 hypothetical protein GCM10011341_23230 [Frigidibacter albus]